MKTKQNTKTVHFCDKYLINPTHPITIALIGCGGTGSLILSRLARLDSALRQLQHPGIHVMAYDGDIVERHNIGRQNFSPNDVGKNKALCLIEKVNFCFGLHWEAQGTFIDSGSIPSANICITAVDDAEFRMMFDRVLKNANNRGRDYNKRFYWMDTGNGKDFGQVVLGTVGCIEQPKKSKYSTLESLPTVIDVYGDMSKYDQEETQGMESCSFADSIKKQDLFINDAVAVSACTLLWKLFKNLSLEQHGVIINQKTMMQQGLKL